MKKNIIVFFTLLFLFSSCTSAKFEEIQTLPEDYIYIYICLDASQTTIGSGPSFSSNNGSFSYNPGWSHSTTLDTIENRNTIIKILTQKGFKITSDLDLADIILLGGYTTNEIRSKVSLTFIDANTEELLFISEGMYGMGWDINGDVRGALKNALDCIPEKNETLNQSEDIIIQDIETSSEMDDIELQLIKLKKLYDNGLIDEDEYKEKKAQILNL